MLAAWSRLSREQRRVWGAVVGVIVAGSVFKVAYFTFSRRLMVNDSERLQLERMEHLREASEYAAWSKRDRESKLPPLTDEQHEQLQKYLKLVDRHGLNMVAAEGKECVGCPVLGRFARKATASLAHSRE